MSFVQIRLVTEADGRARFQERAIPFTEGSPQSRLTASAPVSAVQLRESPPGFVSGFHCTTTPQWVFILRGRMEIGLQDGSTHVFSPGEHFHSADLLPAGCSFDAAVHGHRSRALGDEPLTTLFVRD